MRGLTSQGSRNRFRAGTSRRAGNSRPPRRRVRTRPRKYAAPSESLKSDREPRLLRWEVLEIGIVAGGEIALRVAAGSQSPRISTLTTLAPQSANWRTQVGPARTRKIEHGHVIEGGGR